MTNTVTAPSLEERSVLLMQHLLSISDAIVRTRQEIAELRQEQEAGRARDELQDVIEGTEQATNTILTAAETVATLAVRLGRRAQDQATQDDAAAIQAQMQTVFEACNFQDLTGQRISKVVRTVCLVEERVAEMLHLWAGPAGSTAPCSFPDASHSQAGRARTRRRGRAPERSSPARHRRRLPGRCRCSVRLSL